MSVSITIGQGVEIYGPNGTADYYVTGHSFNPSYSSNWNYVYSGGAYSVYSVSPFSSIDLTNYYPGTEVALAVLSGSGESGTSVFMRWYNPNGTLYYEYDFNYFVSGSIWTFSYTGIKPINNKSGTINDVYGEIYLNGTYTVMGGVLPYGGSGSATFTASNINSSRMALNYGHEGMIWVDGQNIHFISWLGVEIIVANDGVNYGNAGGTTTGSIWVPDTPGATYLCYVDFSGFIRHTKNGDTAGWAGMSGLPSSGHIPGYIWAQGGGGDYTYIMFINYDGNQVRLSSGYMFSGNFQ